MKLLPLQTEKEMEELVKQWEENEDYVVSPQTLKRLIREAVGGESREQEG